MSAGDCFFADSNLLLCSVDPLDAQKRARALEWIDHLWVTGTGRLSWQVLHEFYWNAVRKMRLPSSSAREIVQDLSHWMPVDSSLGLVEQAWYWMDTEQLPYWDALILSAAQRVGARYLLSEDFQANRSYGEIRVLNPFDHAPSLFAGRI